MEHALDCADRPLAWPVASPSPCSGSPKPLPFSVFTLLYCDKMYVMENVPYHPSLSAQLGGNKHICAVGQLGPPSPCKTLVTRPTSSSVPSKRPLLCPWPATIPLAVSESDRPRGLPEVESCSVCPFVTGLFQSAQCPRDVSTVRHV